MPLDARADAWARLVLARVPPAALAIAWVLRQPGVSVAIVGAMRPEQDEQRLGVLAYETLCRGMLTGKFTGAPRFPSTDLRHIDDRFREPLWLGKL